MWDAGGGYERFMGRWSRDLAQRLVRRALDAGARRDRWLDVGCGTGSLTAACLDAGVAAVDAVDPSPAFTAAARTRFARAPVTVHDGDAVDLGGCRGPYAAVASCLVLNFTPDPVAALRAMRATLAADGVGAVAVWAYADERSFLARFWEAVEHVVGGPDPRDERSAFPVCDPLGLAAAAGAAGWDATIHTIDVPTVFDDPTDLWDPFLAGVGPAGAWVAAQDDDRREAVRDRLVASAFGTVAGPVTLPFRALVIGCAGTPASA